MNKNNDSDTKNLLNCIVEAIEEKQGKDIVSIDLSQLGNSICDYFVICHGDSAPQVNAIVRWIEEYVWKNLEVDPLRKQGLENSQWVLLMYDNIVVHIFMKEYRDYYRLEDLWADGKLKNKELIYGDGTKIQRESLTGR